MLKALKWGIAVIGLVALGVVLAVAVKMYLTPEWGEYIAPDKSFEILFPETPIHEAGPAPFPFIGERNFLTSHTDLATYRLSYINLTPGVKGPAEALMADTSAALGGKIELTGSAAALSQLAGTSQSAPPAIDFHIVLDNGSIVYGRIVTTSKKLYQLLVSHPFVQKDPADMRLFFDGFKVKSF
jgi:hypothetical protein